MGIYEYSKTVSIKGISLPAEIIAIDSLIAERAGLLRAINLSLKMPDATILATALVSKAEKLLTTDGQWPQVDELMVLQVGS